MAEPDVGAPIDANGNLTADGIRIFEWDVRNRLVRITHADTIQEITYDGKNRRRRVLTRIAGAIVADRMLVPCGGAFCEERYADGVTVTRRLTGRGELVGSEARFVFSDHLGSTRDVASGSSMSLGRFDYAPFGDRLLVSGQSDAAFTGFTGFDASVDPAVPMARYRAYLPGIGRWASEDPAGLIDGPNMARYSLNNPVTNVDPSGLYTIDKSCQKGCQTFNEGDRDLEKTIASQTNEWCSSLGRITDPKLRRCVEVSCKKGKVRCREKCDPDTGGWNRRIWPFKSRTANLCPNNWPSYTPTAYVGDTVIHKWAHGCGWDHEDGGGIR